MKTIDQIWLCPSDDEGDDEDPPLNPIPPRK